jgi:PAS domain-containing protein
MLEDLGLLPALEMVATQFVQQTGIACTLDAPAGISSEWTEAPEVAICLYRIVQEALNNVLKHARASKVRIRLEAESPDSISLRVIDDGVGMDHLDMRKPDSFGILGMQERVRPHGGLVRIDSVPGKGTTLEVHISRATAPLAGASRAKAVHSGYTSHEEPPHEGLDDAHTLPRLLSRTSHRALQDAIDALAGSVVVIDSRGVIRFVNRAWTEFVRRNGNVHAEAVGPGVNYLDSCREYATFDPAGRNLWQGLDELLHGSRTAFECVYTCHSPDEWRWYQMHAIPMANGDVMVEHFLIRHERRGRD